MLSSVLFDFFRKYQKSWISLSVDSGVPNIDQIVFDDDTINAFEVALLNEIKTPLKRISEVEENLFVAGKPVYKTQCDEFYGISKLLLSVTTEVFDYFFCDFRRKFSSSQDVLLFLSKLKNKDHASECWEVFQKSWKNLFVDIDDVIKLTGFLNENTFNHAINDFKEMIAANYHPALLIHQEDADLALQFLLGVTKKLPIVIKNIRTLVDCILVCKTETHLRVFFSNIALHLDSLFAANGVDSAAKTVVFFEILNKRLLERVDPRPYKKIIYTLCVEHILSLSLSKEKIDRYWESLFSGCWSCFFGVTGINEKDRVFYNQFHSMYAKAGMDIHADCILELAELLSNYIDKNEGGRFLKALKSVFYSDFFDNVRELKAFLQYAPAEVFSPRTMAVL